MHRLFTIIKERTKNTEAVKKEPMMTPDEILAHTETTILECDIKDISQKFLESFRKFVQENLINEIKRVRESIGLKKENIPDKELKAEKKDIYLQKQLRNFTHVTMSQFKEFSQLVWKKYREAIIQPGESVGAICAQSIGEPGT
jgi:hypothetical protein